MTQFVYHTADGALSDHFLKDIRRKKDSFNFVEQHATFYDFWGNPTTLVDADGTLTCLTFTSSRGVLETRKESMSGQSSCAASGTVLETKWERDSALRLTKLVRPDTSCMFFEYDTKGRLLRTKRRDDCNAGATGDKQEFVRDSEGLVTEIQTYDASNVLTAKQPFTYYDSRQLEKAINPVNTSTWTGITYDARGLVSQIDAAGGLGKTVFNRAGTPGAEGRVTSVDKYKTSSTFDTWSLIYAWFGDQKSVTDGDAKVTQTVRDDLGRTVNLISPDMTNLVKSSYDEASRLVTVNERYGAGTDQRNHSFTFDHLGRPLDADYAVGHSAGTCGGSSNPAEIQRVYDAPPTGTCPIGGGTGCTNTQGRLAYVKIRLVCDARLGGDKSLDQETWYAYDAAGRVVVEYIKDDSGRTAQQTFAWTANGDLAQIVTPSGASIDWAYGSAGSNSDKDRIASLSRNVSSTVANAITWNPYGPLKQYNQQNLIGGVAMRTRIARNLAYRPTGVYMEAQSGGAIGQSVVLTEDAKGRVTARDFTSTVSGVRDSYYLYDDQDRVLCETTTFASTCPTSGSTLKNNHSASPPFTNAGDWKTLLRPTPGSTGFTNTFALGTGTHQVSSVTQTSFGAEEYYYLSDGDRYFEYMFDQDQGIRHLKYDNRHNVTQIGGYYLSAGTWYPYWSDSGFDVSNRRSYKTLNANNTTWAAWFFYYDPLDRLTEVRYTPNTSSPGTYSAFQLFWLEQRLVAYWQTDWQTGNPSPTTTKRYVATDETSRPVEMWSWPASGNGAPVWAIDPSAWGFDTTLLGAGIFQPVLFAGQYQDTETTAYLSDGSTIHRPGLALSGLRTYDPFSGSHLQTGKPTSAGLGGSVGYVYSAGNPVHNRQHSGIDPHAVSAMIDFDKPLGWDDCYSSVSTLEVSACLDGTTDWFTGDVGGGWGWPGTKPPGNGCRWWWGECGEFSMPPWGAKCWYWAEKRDYYGPLCAESRESEQFTPCYCVAGGKWIVIGGYTGAYCAAQENCRTDYCHIWAQFDEVYVQHCLP